MSDDYVVNGYRLVNCLRAGQSSQVWEAIQEGTGRKYALKLLHPECVHDSVQRRYMNTEATVGRQLDHPKIIRIFDYYPTKENPHFVMEFFPSIDLKMRIVRETERQTIDQSRRKRTTVLQDHAQAIVEQAAQALAYMHDKKWIHRDIKPDNFLVNGVGEVRLIDFALAQRLGGGLSKIFRRRKRVVQGTRSYMAPEQIRGGYLDERTDIYGLGCTLYEMLTGVVPFRADSPNSLLKKQLYEKVRDPIGLNPDLDPRMCQLIMKMLAKKPENRVTNAHEFLAELRGITILTTKREDSA